MVPLARRGEAVVPGVRRHLPLCPRWKKLLAEGPFFSFSFSISRQASDADYLCFVQDSETYTHLLARYSSGKGPLMS